MGKARLQKDEETPKRGLKGWLRGKELQVFTVGTLAYLLAASFLMGTPKEIFQGTTTIVFSRDALITDYFALTNYGAGLFNATVVLALAFLLVTVMKVPYTGLTMAALFMNVGYGLWGKNPINMLPLLLGTWLYAKVHQDPFDRYVYTALLGTCLSPFVTEMVHILPYSAKISVPVAVVMGMLMGYMLVPLSARTASMHQGYTLFNVGFSGGVLAFIVVCVLKAFGMESGPVLIWTHGIHKGLLAGTFLYFSLTILYGWLACGGSWKRELLLWRHSGRVVTDFVALDGPGVTLMNMGLMGILGTVYVCLIGGDLSGPVLGATLVAVGFSAFGAHPKNVLPVMAGVYLSTLFTRYDALMPGLQLAALFAVGLAPVAGQFGIVPGIVAGMLHAMVVMCTADLYGGLNLYNNGFSTGWIAIIMVPFCEIFLERRKERGRKKN